MTPDIAQLIQALPVGVFILDASGHAVYANDIAADLLGRTIQDGDHAENLAERYAAVRAGTDEPYPTDEMPIVRALAGERCSIDDMEVVRNGERVALEVTAAPIFDEEDRVVFAVAVFHDITERRRIETLQREIAGHRLFEEQLMRANRAKSIFLMNISHELRTPLNHIIGFNELLADRVDDPRNRRLAETAGASGRDLLDKINDLIELARAEADATQKPPTTFDFDALLHRMADAVRLTCDVPKPIGVMQADEEEVGRLLRNILERAGDDTVVSARDEQRGDARRVVVSIASDRLVVRVRALGHLFGEVMYGEGRFKQQDIDFRLAVARAQARRLGGDIATASEGGREVVQLVLPL